MTRCADTMRSTCPTRRPARSVPDHPLRRRPTQSSTVPGSKSITNRALVCAALADGTSTLDRDAVRRRHRGHARRARRRSASRGASIAPPARSRSTAARAPCRSPSQPLDVRQSGTTARFVPPMLRARPRHVPGRRPPRSCGPGRWDRRSTRCGRSAARSRNWPAPVGCRPPSVGTACGAATLRLPGDVSSQFLSGLLLSGPCLPDGLVIEVTTPLVSRPVRRAHRGGDGERSGRRSRCRTAHVRRRSRRLPRPPPTRSSRTPARPRTSSRPPPCAAVGPRARDSDGGRVRATWASLDVLSEMGADVRRDDDSTDVTGTGGTCAASTLISPTSPTPRRPWRSWPRVGGRTDPRHRHRVHPAQGDRPHRRGRGGARPVRHRCRRSNRRLDDPTRPGQAGASTPTTTTAWR